ncbi:MAG: PQQ-binding-like beta-propeller repeat protein, partial [Terriglobales bacterium]
ERTPVVDNGVLYVLSDSSTLYALNAQTGSVLWKEHLGGGASENPGHMAIANGVLYVPFNSIDAFDASNGTLLYQSPEIGVDAISVANGAIYAGASLNDTGVLYAFGLPTGEHF